MLVKCICTNCAGHLEFEEEDAGQKIKCPHCGFNTVLFLPGTEKAEAEVASLTRKLQLQRRLLLAGGAVLVVVAVIWAVYHWIIPVVAGFLPETDSQVLLVLISVMVCLAIPFILAWIVFPVVLFWQLRKLVNLVGQLEENLRSGAEAVPPAPAATEEAPATEDAENV
ncbi:MAG TPA: hypothetical protein VJA21_16955 [Verrucomicrobiae bacterium]